MDQATELLAEEGCAQLIEFNPLQTTRVELSKGAQFVILNSLAEANKAAGSEFNQRVVECRLATKLLAKKLGLTDWKILSKLINVAWLQDKSDFFSSHVSLVANFVFEMVQTFCVES